jgi:formyltetrahydrofolate-dependent phosphoribosylglycinamide formyltransferase
VTALAPLKVAVLISGGGTTLRNLLQCIERGELPLDIRLVVSSSGLARGLEFARAAGLKTLAVEPREQPGVDRFSRAIFDACRAADVDLVVMGGFLKLVRIPDDFAGRVVNIHPSLIPKYCGRGYYGARVHEAVITAGETQSGCTVHFVDEQYDHGPVILQRRVPVLEDDTPETLAARVFAAECEAYPEALRMLAAGRVKLVGDRVEIDGK